MNRENKLRFAAFLALVAIDYPRYDETREYADLMLLSFPWNARRRTP